MPVLHLLVLPALLLARGSLCNSALAGVLIHPCPSDPAQPEGAQEAADRPAAGPGELVFERGDGEPAIRFPRQEVLEYRAYLDLAILSAYVGTVTQTCRVEALRPLILSTEPGPTGEAAVVRLQAEGHYAIYTLKSSIETRALPQNWPRILYLQKSEGTEKHRREVLLGTIDGKSRASYRKDTDTGAPEGTRIWKTATEREVPDGTLDMLSAVFMARTLIREQLESVTFPLIDKSRLWQLQLSRGQERRMETGAGAFDVVEIVLAPGPYPGEVFEKEKLKKFEGVFGIHGTIHLWVEKHTGIAVRIQGDIPVGLTLGVDVILQSYSGTPSDFATVE